MYIFLILNFSSLIHILILWILFWWIYFSGQESREYVLINKFVVDAFLWTSSYSYSYVTMTICEHVLWMNSGNSGLWI